MAAVKWVALGLIVVAAFAAAFDQPVKASDDEVSSSFGLYSNCADDPDHPKTVFEWHGKKVCRWPTTCSIRLPLKPQQGGQNIPIYIDAVCLLENCSSAISCLKDDAAELKGLAGH